jgi:DNA-binding transcriptional LysR family regulator
MELGELRVFVTVATEHSFSRAAVKLCRTQPAVSQALRRLEDDLGERLIDRSTKHATLTPAGDALLPEAIRLLQLAEEAATTVRRHSQRERAVLRIGSDEHGAYVLLPTLSSFLSQQPDISVEFRRIPDLEVPGEVGTGSIDIGVTNSDRVASPLASLRVQLPSAGFCVLMPETHHLAACSELRPSFLHEERIITVCGMALPQARRSPHSGETAPPVGSFIVMPGIDSLKHAVAVGLGIGVVPRAMVSSGGAGIGLTAVPLSAERGTRALTVVYRESDQTPTAANEFIEALRSAGASASTPVFIRTAR